MLTLKKLFLNFGLKPLLVFSFIHFNLFAEGENTDNTSQEKGIRVKQPAMKL